MNAADLLGLPWMEGDLARLEVVLHRMVAAEDPFLTEVATHLVAGGGKRLRPILSLVSAAAAGLGQASEDILLGGVSVEMVHLASLYHDDVIDEATQRRNVESVNSRWGNLLAVIAGDFLLARAAGIAASLGTEVASLLAATLARMMEGQVREVQGTFDQRRTESAYLASIAGKTASLTATACRVGALTACLDRRTVEALTTYGECFGMVFQIRDDILDVVATEEELGKLPGQDLMEGVYTLPILRALADRCAGPELAPLLGRRLDGSELDQAMKIVAGSGAIGSAVGEARLWADRATAVTTSLGSGQVGDCLRDFAHALVDSVAIYAT
ncbi:MAG: polyprenyl synthetase family protein [Acidimicrobiales bacterium]